MRMQRLDKVVDDSYEIVFNSSSDANWAATELRENFAEGSPRGLLSSSEYSKSWRVCGHSKGEGRLGRQRHLSRLSSDPSILLHRGPFQQWPGGRRTRSTASFGISLFSCLSSGLSPALRPICHLSCVRAGADGGCLDCLSSSIT